jgi:hypothetical protein
MRLSMLARSTISGSHAAAQDGGAVRAAEEDGRAPQAVAAGDHVAAVELDAGAELGEALQVQVDRARAEGAAARHADHRAAAAREHRAEHADRRTHGLDDLVRRVGARLVARVERDGVVVEVHGDAEALEERPQVADVREGPDVGEAHAPRGEERGGHERQGRVLGAFDGDAAVESAAALNAELIHGEALDAGRYRSIRDLRVRDQSAFRAAIPQ